MPIGSTSISGEFLKIQNFHFGIFCCFFMADEEVDRSRTGEDDEEKTRSISSERNHKNYVSDEVEIENETEKSGEARKHDSKDRKKEKREEKDYNSKVKDKSRQREKWDISGRDKKHDSRERMGSRERRMEDQEDYSKELDSVKEKVRDKGWEERDKGMEWDKDKVMDRTRERSIDGKRDHHRDHVKNKGRESEKQKEVERDRGFHREHGHGKERDKVHRRHTDRDKDKKDRDNGYDKSKVTDRDQYKETDKELERDSLREKDRERGKDRAKEKDKDRFRPKDREKEKLKDREMEVVSDRVGERDKFEKDKGKKKHREKEPDMTTDQGSRGRDGDGDISRGKEVKVEENILGNSIVEIHKSDDAKAVGSLSSSELVGRLKRMKENRRKGNSEAVSEVLSWVDRSRKLEENRNVEKEKTIALSRMLDEQDKILEESEDEELAKDNGKDLAGVKVLHGLDKVMEGGAVVLTLKDQSILADGDINEEVDMLENVEIGEQKRRDEAYRAAKKTGIYDDKFSEDLSSRKTILSQYDDPIDDEGVTLDESGRFTGEAEKKLAELRKRMEGSSLKDYEDLSSSGKVQSDYFTTDEMLQFKKPKKKKSLRKKERLDLDALEAEAKAAGLGDLGSRGDMKRLSAREEEEKSMAKARSSAYQEALAKAEEASKVLRQGQSLTSKPADSDILVFGEDYEDLHRSLEQARRLSLKKKDEAVSSGPQAVALLATAHKEKDDSQSSASGETQENKVVITEMEEFVLGLQINEETSNPETEYVFKEDEDVPMSIDPESNAQAASLTEAKETEIGELPSTASEDVSPDGIIHEIAVGKGLAGALNLLKGRGTLKESIDWGGRNMDKRKSKLVGLYDSDGSKEIRIERTDEFGRIMTPKEAFRILSHKFHGKGPGMMKQEKRMKQYQEDLKAKQMKASDTPLLAMEKMRDAQARLKTPYLVLSGHVKPGQTSDPRSGFATVEKDNLGSLTPMLGDKKVEHFLGIRSKPESGNMGPPPPKKPKT